MIDDNYAMADGSDGDIEEENKDSTDGEIQNEQINRADIRNNNPNEQQQHQQQITNNQAVDIRNNLPSQ